jgi:hypothetical protein
MADWKTLWTVASKLVRGTAQPMDIAWRGIRAYFRDIAAWVVFFQTAYGYLNICRSGICGDY